jgi:hypothetical protein
VNTTRWKRSTATVLLAALLSQGCAAPGARLQYLIGEDKTIEHYRDYATSIEYPTESEARESDPNLFRAPRRITSLEEVSQRHIKLEDCIKMALSNATILRDDQSFGSPGNALLANPSRVASVYDTAIQDTSFLLRKSRHRSCAVRLRPECSPRTCRQGVLRILRTQQILVCRLEMY